MKKAICQTCCLRYREYPDWIRKWGSLDEDRWKTNKVDCPGPIKRDRRFYRPTDIDRDGPPPWCVMAVEQVVLSQ
jgi:hypothetical protein